jgi:hypothetical protein
MNGRGVKGKITALAKGNEGDKMTVAELMHYKRIPKKMRECPTVPSRAPNVALECPVGLRHC